MADIFNIHTLKEKKGYYFLVPIIGFAVFAVLTGFANGNNTFGYIHEIVLTAAGGFAFLLGFHELRKKRLLENIPTSTIRSAAMGLCEIKGFAKDKFPLKSPITLTDCAYYKFLIEKEVKDSKGNRHWKTVSQGNSTTYFYVEDETGRMLVDPLGAETFLIAYYKYTDSAASLIAGRKRYTEWYIKNGDNIYAFGTLRKFKDEALERQETLRERLLKLKNDREKLKEFDTDKDGQISADEWDKAREAVEAKMLEDELNKPKNPDDDIILAKGDNEDTFILSDEGEERVRKHIGYRSFFLVFGGFIVIIIAAGSMIARAGLLPGIPPIPWETFYK